MTECERRLLNLLSLLCFAACCSAPFVASQSGIDATRGIRAAGFERLIFGLTGDALDEDVQGFLDAGADCVIGKVTILLYTVLLPTACYTSRFQHERSTAIAA